MQQLVQLVAPGGSAVQQGFVGQVHQQRQADAGDLLDGSAGEPAAEDCQGLEGFLVGRAEQAPGIVENRPDAALAFGQVAHPAGEDIQALGQLDGDLLQAEHFDPGRRQQDAQRHALHQAADAGHEFQLVFLQLESGLHAPGALHEELDGAVF